MPKLSTRSIKRLQVVHPKLRKVVEKAIVNCAVDFEVNDISYPLNEGTGYAHSVNLIVMVAGKGQFEIEIYDKICEAMKVAADELQVPISWGGAGDTDIRAFTVAPNSAQIAWIEQQLAELKRPVLEVYRFNFMGD